MALELWRRVGDRLQQARALGRRGRLHRLLGGHAMALVSLEQALDLFRDLQNSAGVASTIGEMATVHRRRGENDRALALYHQALAIWQKLGDASHEARVRNNLATLLHSAKGELRAALPHYEHALKIFQQIGDRVREAKVLVSLGHLHSQLGELDRAVIDFERALALCEALDRRELAADVLNNLGVTLDRLGEIHDALRNFSAAREIYRELGNPRRQAAALNSQGSLLLDLGLPEEAQQLLSTAAELLREHSDVALESHVLLGLGAAARDLGDVTIALDRFEQAHNLQRRASDRGGQALALYHQATIQQRTGRSAIAHELATQALTIFSDVGNVQGEIWALRVFGQSAAAGGRIDVARDAFEQAIARAEKIDGVTEVARSLHDLGRLEHAQGQYQAALAHFERALTHFESLRARVSGEHLRTSHFATVREVYELAVDSLMQLHGKRTAAGFDRRALALSERARARGLLDVVSRARLNSARIDVVAPELHRREKQVRRELNALALRRHRTTPDAALKAHIAALTAEYRLLEGRLSRPEETRVRGLAHSPHFFEELTKLVDENLASSEKTVLLEFTLGDPRSYLWVVSDGHLESFELPSRATIEAAAERLHRHLRQPVTDRAGRRSALEELSQMVLAPAFGHLATRRWVIVPEGALHYVPFAALPVPTSANSQMTGQGTEPLMVAHEVVHLPSMAVLAQLRSAERRVPEGRLAILADPVYDGDDPRVGHLSAVVESEVRDSRSEPLARLPWSRHEAQAIANEAGDDDVLLALGFDASRELATAAELGQYQMIHFATHGVLDTQRPEFSGLAFSGWSADGQWRESFLRLHDIYGLQWQAELVVLSGCQTALGQSVRGEGLVGLARGFLHAGARRVVASLWSVRDQATAELMRRFYHALFHGRQAPAAALQAAQLSMWRERRWRDPYFWAPFIIIGDWQETTTSL